MPSGREGAAPGTQLPGASPVTAGPGEAPDREDGTG
jgi:hypothetical protein